MIYLPEDGDLSPKKCNRIYVYGWVVILYKIVCICLCIWMIIWMKMGGLRAQIRNQDITITKQKCSPLCHNFWISLYSFFGSFLSSASTFHLTTLILESAEKVNYRTCHLTSQQQSRTRCVTLNSIACRFVALSLCTRMQYSLPPPPPANTHRWHWNTL
jgi:hypothetical protein